MDQQGPERARQKRAYYLAHRNEILLRSKRWYHNNRDKRRMFIRAWELRQYGLTLEAYQAMHTAQEGRCLVCSTAETKLVVDHCHETNRVRGLLCGPCNRVLGLMRDNPEHLRAAAAYLERTPRETTDVNS